MRFPMWKYIADGSRMGEATVVALAIALGIVLVGSALAFLDVRRGRALEKSFGRGHDLEAPLGANRDAV